MKKLLLAGALSAVTAFSSSAFAAVSYGESDTLTLTYDPTTNKVSVTTDLSTYDGQMTVLVLDKDAAAVNSDTILYIDQEAAPASGSKIFQNMGIKLPANVTTLPAGTYPVKVGSDDTSMTSILVGNIIVSEDESGKVVKFVFGDVNGGEYTGTATTDISCVDASDALDIIRASVGGATAKGGIADIGAVVKTKDGKKFVFGDVNGGEYTGTATTDISCVDASDALDIIRASVGGATAKGGIADVGAVVEAVLSE